MAKLSKELRTGIHNRFDIEVVDVKTGKVKQKARGYNTICNNYYTCILNKTQALYIQIGSGSGTPSPSDTGLFSYVGFADANSSYSLYDRIDTSREHEGIWSRQFKRVIPNNQYVGSTITEIGLATGSSGNNIVTHAILKDMNGNPISIEHTATDIIYIYCTVYLHYENQHSDIHLWLGRTYSQNYPSSYNNFGIVGRILLSAFGAYYEDPMAVMGNDFLRGGFYWESDFSRYDGPQNAAEMGRIEGRVVQTNDTQNKSITFTFPQLKVGAGNVSGLSQVGLSLEGDGWRGGNRNYSGNEVTIEAGGTVFPPSHVTNESVGIGDGSQTKFKTKFNYPYNAVVYVNGVRQNSGVTVKKLPCYAITNNFYPIPTNKVGWQLFKRVFPEDVTLIKPAASGNSFTNSYWSDNYGVTGIPIYGSNGNYGFVIADGDAIECLVPEIGIYGIGGENGTIKGSNDGITWVDIPTQRTIAGKPSMMDQTYAHYKYYKNTRNGTQGANIVVNNYDGYNIIFDNPPASGDVITVDYDCDKILKDADHVLDVSITLTFGEWTGE